MNNFQIGFFLKAPFRQQFMFVCLLFLPILLVCPLLSNIMGIFYTHGDFIQSADEAAIEKLVLQRLLSLDPQIYIALIVGIVFTFLFSGGYFCMLMHKMVKQKSKLFEFKAVVLTNQDVFKGILKIISFCFWGLCYFILYLSAICLFIYLAYICGRFLPTFLSVLLWIVFGLVCLGLTLWAILNSFVSQVLFCESLKTRAIFQWRENYLFVKKYKSRVFISFGLCFIFLQIVSVIGETLSNWLLTGLVFTAVCMALLGVGQMAVPCFFAIVLLIFALVYMELLFAIFKAKTFVWIKQKPKKK